MNVPEPSRGLVVAIACSGLTIYDEVQIGSKLWIPSPDLERLLDEGLRGLDLRGLPLRSRSKFVKAKVCEILGYPVPRSFTKTKPRFPGQRFDTYVQKSRNLQVWNEELSATRRYVVIRVSAHDVIERVRVVTGEDLARFDTTGTLTQKYQARLELGREVSELISPTDTENLQPLLGVPGTCVTPRSVPTDTRAWWHPADSSRLRDSEGRCWSAVC
jgi:hypothetical protein